MLNEYEISMMKSIGYAIQPKPLNYSGRRTTFLAITPEGKTLEVYEDWVDFNTDYETGLIPIGWEGSVQITNGDEWINGPGIGSNGVWEHYTELSAGGYPIDWLILLAIVIAAGILANIIVYQIDKLLHPCEPLQTPLPNNRKEIQDPDCTKYILDLETGRIIEQFGGTSWVPLVIWGALAVVAIIFIAPAVIGAFKKSPEEDLMKYLALKS